MDDNKLNKFLKRIKQTNNLIIVDGIKDKIAMSELGAKNIIILSKSHYFK